MRPLATRGEMSKRKIQAQRKFAQGAVIPTNLINAVVRNDLVTIVKEDQNIIHSSLPAKNLLDIVAFQSIHAHKSPVVLLERLETKPLQVPKPMSLKDRRNTITKKVPTRLIKKVVGVKKPVVPKVKRQRRISETISTDEDETPLKFLKEGLDQRQSALSGRPNTRTYTKYQANELKKKIKKENEASNSAQERNAVEKISHSETGNSQVIPNVITLRSISQLMPLKCTSVQESNAGKKTPITETGNSQVKNIITRKRDLMSIKFTSMQEINAVTPETVSDVKRDVKSTPEKVEEISRELPDDETINDETMLSSVCSNWSDIRLEYLDSDLDDIDNVPNLDNEMPHETAEVTPAIVQDNNTDSNHTDIIPNRDIEITHETAEVTPAIVQDINTDSNDTYVIPNCDIEMPHETAEVTPAIVQDINTDSNDTYVIPNCDIEMPHETAEVTPAIVQDINTDSNHTVIIPNRDNEMPHETAEVTPAVVQDINTVSVKIEPCPGTSRQSSKHEMPKKTTDASTSTNHEEISLQDINPDLDAIGPAQKEKDPAKTGQFYGNTGIRTWMDSARPHCETANQPESTKKRDVYKFDPEMENRPYSKFERNKKSEGPVFKPTSVIVNMKPDKKVRQNNMFIVNASIAKRNNGLNNRQIASEDNLEVVCIESASDDDVVEVVPSIANRDSGAVPSIAGTSTSTPTPGIAAQRPGNVTQQTDRLNQPSVSNVAKNTRRMRYDPCEKLVDKTNNYVDAPVYHPTEEEFKDPILLYEKAFAMSGKYGVCKVVAPPSFKPTCKQVDINFRVENQYIGRMYNRWGPAAREMSTIKAYLHTQNVLFTRPPLHEGLELNLPKLYRLVQRHGGLNQVIEKERWSEVAGAMRCNTAAKASRRLDKLYVKYLLPYYTLSNHERHQTTAAVERYWNKKNHKLLEWALNPLHRQKKLLGDSDSSDDEEEEPEPQIKSALADAEDCVMKGRNMNLVTFEKIAKTADEVYYAKPTRSASEVEEVYWRTMLLGSEHICVNTASIDTGHAGYGFTNNRAEPFGTHPWNLKMISENSGNVLRSLRSVLGVTVPTLHLGMLYSTSCWHRDPHGLPWMEYMHSGPTKIWYGIPNEQSSNFRKAVETLCPSSCQNKSIWLPSDVAMIPPNLLQEHNVSLSRIEQNPGEFVIVFPKAYSCSISTGYTQSESAYFATSSWLNSVHQVFQELRDSCEPTTFSVEQLLIALAEDMRVPLGLLPQVHSSLKPIITEELNYRRQLEQRGLESPQKVNYWPMYRTGTVWNVRDFDECEICRTTLYLSKVTGITGRHSKVCLQHALRLLDTPRHRNVDLATVQLLIAFTEKNLNGFILTVEHRLFGERN